MDISPSDADRALLRRFEPIIRFTQGEQFFPMEVKDYLRYCSLWVQRPHRQPYCLVPIGQVTLEKLAAPRHEDFEATYFLKFSEAVNLAQVAQYRFQQGGRRSSGFHVGRGRLARVGQLSRLMDAIFALGLFARGRVPGDTAVGAALRYEEIVTQSPYYSYYGRVVRSNGWIALQYWFFYAFNNWRSGFYGANDHESDWEMVYIYLSETAEGDVQPEWLAYASHDFKGDDLRRHWHDPEVEKMGQHPIIYAGAGSHASYFAAGEYLPEIELPFLLPLVRLVERQQKFWRKILRQYSDDNNDSTAAPSFNIFKIPFVDYARGDGLAIGPGQTQTWQEPILLDPTPPWAMHYRGLWGLYTNDPFSGEDAPAGPVYNRDGSVRRSWYDPLGWSGLDKVLPRHQLLSKTLARWEDLEERQNKLTAKIETKQHQLADLGIELAAMQGQPHFRKIYAMSQKKVMQLSGELNQLRAEWASLEAIKEALALYTARLKHGDPLPMRAHIRRAHHPTSEIELRLDRLTELWAAISIGLLMISLVLLVIFARNYLIFGLVTLLSLIVFIEASSRKQLQRLISSITISLAAISTLIILVDFFWPIITVSVLIASSYIMWQNLRELWT